MFLPYFHHICVVYFDCPGINVASLFLHFQCNRCIFLGEMLFLTTVNVTCIFPLSVNSMRTDGLSAAQLNVVLIKMGHHC